MCLKVIVIYKQRLSQLIFLGNPMEATCVVRNGKWQIPIHLYSQGKPDNPLSLGDLHDNYNDR